MHRQNSIVISSH